MRKKHQKSKNNLRLEAHRKTFLVLVMIMFSLFLTGFVLAQTYWSPEKVAITYIGSDDTNSNIGATTDRFAQTFRTTSEFNITKIRIKTSKSNNPGVITLELRDINATGGPGSNIVTSNTTIDTASWSGTDYRNITLPTTNLSINKNYTFVLYTQTGDGSNFVSIRVDNTLPSYEGGTVWISTDSGSSYGNLTRDAIFTIFGNYSSIDFIENSNNFNQIVTSGSSETYTLNITYNSSFFTNSLAYLVYNGTQYTGTKSGSGDNILFTKSLNVPGVSATGNFTFYWSIILNNGTDNYYNSSFNNQTVSLIGIDNCSLYSNLLYNFTMVNEETQDKINPLNENTTTTSKVDIQMYTKDRSIIVSIYSHLYNATNSFNVCMANISSASYSLDAQIEYYANNYSREFYHIQNATITNSTLGTNITLYDLLYDNTKVFKVFYKNEKFLPVKDALINIQRKYVDEGVFKTVEIPKTDINGETLAHLQLYDVIYTFTVTKNGEILGIFDNLLVKCEDLVLGTCNINLNSYASSVSPEDFTVSDDFIFDFSFNETTRTLTSTFSVPSSTVATVILNTTLYDNVGSTQLCSDSLTSSAGTLTCTIPESYGNVTAYTRLLKNGVEVGNAYLTLNPEPRDLYGNSIIFIGLVMMLTLVGVGVSSEPMITGFFVLLGVIMNIALNVVDGSFIGKAATFLWLAIAIIIILIKGAGRN